MTARSLLRWCAGLLAFALSAGSVALAQPVTTTSQTIAATAWVELCSTPCRVQVRGAQPALISVGSVAPISELNAMVLRPEAQTGEAFRSTGLKVFGRSLSNETLVAILPADSGSNSNMGGQTGSVTAPGTSGTQAQTIQGNQDGVPVPVAQLDGFRPWGTAGGATANTDIRIAPPGPNARVRFGKYEALSSGTTATIAGYLEIRSDNNVLCKLGVLA